MQVGMVGLGKMGGAMATRLKRAGHDVVGYDRDPEISDVESLKELVERLGTPRVVWVMVPAGRPTEETLTELGDMMDSGDVLIDGGNSFYEDSMRHGELCAERGVDFLDVGVSGGVWGLENGYGLMAGGESKAVERCMPVFDALRPESGGFVHAGDTGAGHFTKMVHNGIEYGIMQAYGEGFELLDAAKMVKNIPEAVEAWRHGTVIRSWLLDLMSNALQEDPALEQLRGYAEDSGEGRWTVQSAVSHAVPVPVISAALFARFSSRQDDSPAIKVVAALRNQFGGHAVTSAAGSEEKGADAPGAGEEG